MSKSLIVTELRLRDMLRSWMVDEINVEIPSFCSECGEALGGDPTFVGERLSDRLLDAISRGVFPGLSIDPDVPRTRHVGVQMFDAALVFDAGGGP